MPFDPNKWIFEIIAIYAAIISTVTLYYFLAQSRINIRVSALRGEEAGLNKSLLVITAVNNGKRPLTITLFGVITPEGKKIVVPGTDSLSSIPALPTRLKDGQACTGYFDLDKNLTYLYHFGKTVVLKGFFIDAEKRDYSSDPIEVALPTLPDNVKILIRPGDQKKADK
ncbi:MAG: hypothetical protein ACYDEQ_07050 [Desulfocucumaceae bacterium]